MTGASRCRVHKDRLWDADGLEWSSTLGQWAGPDEVAALLAAGTPVVVHGFGRPFRTLTTTEARRLWSKVSSHFEVPGRLGAEPDDNGLTYAAQVWTRGKERLLAFVESC